MKFPSIPGLSSPRSSTVPFVILSLASDIVLSGSVSTLPPGSSRVTPAESAAFSYPVKLSSAPSSSRKT